MTDIKMEQIPVQTTGRYDGANKYGRWEGRRVKRFWGEYVGVSRRNLILWLLLLGIATFLWFQSCEKWGDPIIDLGRELYLPRQLLDGRLLYRDIIYNYGPLAPYLLALVVRLFGDALSVFQVFGVITGVAALAALYATGLLLAGRGVAFFSALFFLLFSFFSCSPYGCKNFVLPYSYAATLSAVFTLWSFYFLLRYLYQGGQTIDWWSSVLLLLLAIFTKAEYGAAVAAVHLLAWRLHRIPRRKTLPVLVAGALVALVLILIFAWDRSEGHDLFAENIARFVANSGAGKFFSTVAGIDNFLANALVSLLAFGKLAVLSVVAIVGATVLGLFPKRRVLALVGGCFLGAIWVLLTVRWGDYSLFAAVPLCAAIALCYACRCERHGPLPLLAALVLFSSVRIILNYSPIWYGFYLAVPSYLFVSYLAGSRLPEWLPASRRAPVLMALLALTIMGRYEWRNWNANRAMSSVLVTEKGKMCDFPTGRSEAIAKCLQYLSEVGADGATLVVFPEGVSLNYFSGMKNPLAYYNFIPPEIGSPREEAFILGELRRSRPSFIIQADRDLSEFGRQGFGIDYALEIGSWIKQNYVHVKEFGGPEPADWRLTLLQFDDRSEK